MVNKYWGSEYVDIIERVRAWNDLEKGTYGEKGPRGYRDFKWYDLTEAQIDAQINKAQDDFRNFFYCPVCGRKSLIKDAVVKRKVIDHSFKLDNAVMPGWMKFQASSDSLFIRVCPECATKNISDGVLGRAFEGNAIETNSKRTQAEANSGCLGMIAMIATMAAASVALLLKLFFI